MYKNRGNLIGLYQNQKTAPQNRTNEQLCNSKITNFFTFISLGHYIGTGAARVGLEPLACMCHVLSVCR